MKFIRNICLATLAATSLTVSADLNLPVKTINGTEYYYYEVKPKESIYSLVRKIGVSRDDIMRYNPSAVDGLRANQLLLFPVSEFAGNERREVCPEESVKDGPRADLGEEKVDMPSVDAVEEVDEKEETFTDDSDDETDVAAVDSVDTTVRLAVVLPFMLDAERPTKHAENYTEFYRGLLMAVDTVAGKNPDMKISVAAFDSEASAEKVAALADDPELRSATYIIAPDDSVSIELLAEMADQTGATVVNLFSVKNDAQQRHPSVYQANIPQHKMYDKALDAFIDDFADYTPVILSPADIAADKQAFVDELTSRLESAGRRYEKLDVFDGFSERAMTPDRFPADGRFVFIPASGSREMLTRILSPLIQLRQNASLPDNVRLFGYPEWVIVRGEQARKLHSLDTVIYSRFASDTDSYPTRLLGMRYDDWFGTKMANAVPVYGLLGYDAGRWMLGGGQSYVGLQNSFEPGAVNSALYLIYFSPDGQVRVKAL